MVCAGGGFAGGAAGYAALAVRVVLPHRRTLKLAMIRAASTYCPGRGLQGLSYELQPAGMAFLGFMHDTHTHTNFVNSKGALCKQLISTCICRCTYIRIQSCACIVCIHTRPHLKPKPASKIPYAPSRKGPYPNPEKERGALAEAKRCFGRHPLNFPSLAMDPAVWPQVGGTSG